MARLIQGLAGPAPVPQSADPLTDLTRLLNRLQQTVLRADAEREKRLRTSEYERRKVATNVNYARGLLAKVEQDAQASKIHLRRQEFQAELSRKREVVEQLVERMHDLEEIATAVAGTDEDDESSEGEDILSDIIATPSESLDSSSTVPIEGTEDDEDFDDVVSPPVAVMNQVATESRVDEQASHHLPPPPAGEIPMSEKGVQGTTTTQEIRSRNLKDHPEKDVAVSTSASLFGDRTGTGVSPTATTEAILDHQRAEQDFLLESLSKMATELKASSRSFAASLEEDKDLITKAGEGLEKNERGLDAASRRMGTLRKMTEGKGWWGRMILYAWIYGLMVVLVLLVFVLPKFRFSTW